MTFVKPSLLCLLLVDPVSFTANLPCYKTSGVILNLIQSLPATNTITPTYYNKPIPPLCLWNKITTAKHLIRKLYLSALPAESTWLRKGRRGLSSAIMFSDGLKHHKLSKPYRRRCPSNWYGKIRRAVCRCVRKCVRRNNRVAPATDWPAGVPWYSRLKKSERKSYRAWADRIRWPWPPLCAKTAAQFAGYF